MKTHPTPNARQHIRLPLLSIITMLALLATAALPAASATHVCPPEPAPLDCAPDAPDTGAAERAAEAEAALWATTAGPFALVEEHGATLPVELDDAARAALQLAAWTTEARLQGSCARAVPPVALDSPALQPVVSNLSAQPEVGERFEEVWSQARHSRALCARVLQERDDLAAQTVGGIEGLPLG